MNYYHIYKFINFHVANLIASGPICKLPGTPTLHTCAAAVRVPAGIGGTPHWHSLRRLLSALRLTCAELYACYT